MNKLNIYQNSKFEKNKMHLSEISDHWRSPMAYEVKGQLKVSILHFNDSDNMVTKAVVLCSIVFDRRVAWSVSVLGALRAQSGYIGT
jgi:hypothetical protein